MFVHGPNGDPRLTWTSDKYKTFWPRQLLPSILEEEKARILVYGYEADIESFTDDVRTESLHRHAELLLAELAGNRQTSKATERPLIFVAHSLGGLVVSGCFIVTSS